MHKLMREENNKDVANNRVELLGETELKLYNQYAFFYIPTQSITLLFDLLEITLHNQKHVTDWLHVPPYHCYF